MTVEFLGGPMDGDVATLTCVPLDGEYVVPLAPPPADLACGDLPSEPPPIRVGVYRLGRSTRGKIRPVLQWMGER